MTTPQTDRAAWLVLTYRLPAGRGAVKARVRRTLTAAGAVYPAGSVGMLPASSQAERLRRRLRKMVTDAGGTAVLLTAEALAGEADLVAAQTPQRAR